jgi:hypothetical protein
MEVSLPVGAGLEQFTARSREKLAVLFAECQMKAARYEGKPFVLYSKHLESNYGRAYAAFIRYLRGLGVLHIVPYRNGLDYFEKHSRQFVVKPWGGGFERVRISKAVQAQMKQRRSVQADELCAAIEGGAYLLKSYARLSLDTQAANSFLDGVERGLKLGEAVPFKASRNANASPWERLQHRRLVVEWFEHGGLSWNEYTGRVFSPFTNLPSELRPFLRAEGVSRLALIDVRNSQPFVLCALYALATNDKGPLSVAASGRFYEAVQAGCSLQRDEVKRGVLAAIYGNSMRPRSEAGRALAATFPKLWDWICRERVKPLHLAVRMQRAEAAWVLGVAVELAKRGAFVTSIHDAILINLEQVDEVREALAGAAFEAWGERPSFGVEAL